MKNPDQTVYLRHIRDAVQANPRYVAGVDHETFLRPASQMLRDAVLHQVQIVGEAAQRLSPELRNRYPVVPWRQIIGTRHRIVHDYFNVNL